MASNPLFIIPDFFVSFPNELRFEGNGKIPLGRQGRPFSLPSQRNFTISFKPKVAIAKFIGKMQKKVWYFKGIFSRHFDDFGGSFEHNYEHRHYDI